MSLTAYIRYDQTGRIVPGGPIVVKDKPAVGNWQPVIAGTNVTLVGQLRAFVKLDRYNKPLASTLFLGKERPATGKWIEVNATYTGAATPSTTTTTTTINSTSTTSTTTQALTFYNLGYAAYGTAQPCAGQGYMNAPLIINLNNVCSGGTVTLASGDWSDYNIPTDLPLFVRLGNGSLVEITPTAGVPQAVNSGCQSC